MGQADEVAEFMGEGLASARAVVAGAAATVAAAERGLRIDHDHSCLDLSGCSGKGSRLTDDVTGERPRILEEDYVCGDLGGRGGVAVVRNFSVPLPTVIEELAAGLFFPESHSVVEVCYGFG